MNQLTDKIAVVTGGAQGLGAAICRRLAEELGQAGVRERALADVRRAYEPLGVARQLAAVTANGDRRPKLAKIKAPVVVLHGDVDPLVPVEGGRDTAASIAGAELRIVPGMGHEVPADRMVTLYRKPLAWLVRGK